MNVIVLYVWYEFMCFNYILEMQATGFECSYKYMFLLDYVCLPNYFVMQLLASVRPLT